MGVYRACCARPIGGLEMLGASEQRSGVLRARRRGPRERADEGAWRCVLEGRR